MSTITAILEADADGTLHLPVPEEMRTGKVKVTATLVATDPDSHNHPQLVSDETLAQRIAALTDLRSLGGLKESIPDPVAWQREIRKDRSLPGRD